MDSTVKSLVITGSAVEDAARSRQKATGSRKKRLVVKEEDEEDDKEFIEKVKAISVKPQPVPVKPQIIQPVPKPLPPPIIESSVILKPLKQPRVKLQPKMPIPNRFIENTTRKARRIHMSVSNLSHRFTRAKKVKDDSDKKSVETIREYLVEKGVIQPMSKAPERMLRSMYSDFMLLKDQAL